MMCEYVFVLWTTINPSQKQDYLFYLRYKLVTEVQFLFPLGVSHGNFKNEGMERSNSALSRVQERGISKNSGNKSMDLLLNQWVVGSLRPAITAKQVDLKLIKGGKKKIPVRIQGDRTTMRKKALTVPSSGAERNKFKFAFKHILARTKLIVGESDLLENEDNYEKKEHEVNENGKRVKKTINILKIPGK